MALANVAALLAKWGQRVLVVDWDLEAPGLEKFFLRWVSGSRKQTPGLIEIIQNCGQTNILSWKDCILRASIPDAETISIISAGKDDDEYSTRLRQLNWDFLFQEKGFGLFLEKLRKEWAQEYDFILIDSRTGVTDIGGICTIHLPDILVTFFTTTEQSLLGVKDVMHRASHGHSDLPVDRCKLIIIPIPARDESHAEYELAAEWRKRFAENLKDFYVEWIPKGETAERVMDYLKIPYFSYWSFGEKLPVLEEDPDNPKKLAFSYQLVARLMLGNLDWEEVRKGTKSTIAETSYQNEIQHQKGEAERLAEVLREAQRDREESRFRQQVAAFLGERWIPALEENKRRAKWRYLYLGFGGFFSLSLFSAFFTQPSVGSNAIVGIIVMGSISLLLLVNWWRGMKAWKVAEWLQKERWSYEGRSGQYADLDQWPSLRLFLENVETVLANSKPIRSLKDKDRDTRVSFPTGKAAQDSAPSGTSGEGGMVVSSPENLDSSIASPEILKSYDVFLSYSGSTIITPWVQETFLPMLLGWLSQLLGREATVFQHNVSISPGELWIPNNQQPINVSHCIMPLFTPAYFQSDKVAGEWDQFIKVHSRKILPIMLQEGTYPEPSYTLQLLNFSEFLIVGEGFKKSPLYVDFQRQVKELAVRIVSIINENKKTGLGDRYATL